jgi:manganese/zinc/iron transport system permease protein
MSAWHNAASFFDYDFAVDGLLAGTFVGTMCGVVGVFMALRRLALIGDATSHAALPGVCAAFLLTGSKAMPVLLVGALITGVLANAAISWIESRPRTRSDASIGVVLSVAFGIGAVLLGIAQASPTGAQSGLNSFLFGSVAAVSRPQVLALFVAAALTVAAIAALRRPLTLAVFDPTFAGSVGLNVARYEFVLLISLALAVVVSVNTVGVVLVSAMLIIPPSTALLLTRRVESALIVSGAVGAFAGAAGAFASFLYAGLSSGPAMVLAATILFAIALAARTVRTHRSASV